MLLPLLGTLGMLPLLCWLVAGLLGASGQPVGQSPLGPRTASSPAWLPTAFCTLLPCTAPVPPLYHPAAASANAYLSQLPGLACLHVLPDPAVEEECNEDGDAYARQPIPLPGARTLTLPQASLAGLGLGVG